jgi:hypothetical protein
LDAAPPCLWRSNLQTQERKACGLKRLQIRQRRKALEKKNCSYCDNCNLLFYGIGEFNKKKQQRWSWT